MNEYIQEHDSKENAIAVAYKLYTGTIEKLEATVPGAAMTATDSSKRQ